MTAIVAARLPLGKGRTDVRTARSDSIRAWTAPDPDRLLPNSPHYAVGARFFQRDVDVMAAYADIWEDFRRIFQRSIVSGLITGRLKG